MVHVQMANNHYKEINGNSGNEAFLQPPSSVPFSRFFLRGGGGCTQTMATLMVIVVILATGDRTNMVHYFWNAIDARKSFSFLKYSK